jgi:general secretion pathway protein B
MSYILDALKKIEHDKERKRPDGRISITGDLFQERSRPVKRDGTWKVIVLVASVALLTCVATWFVTKGNRSTPAGGIRPVAAPLAAPATPPPVATTPTARPIPVVASVPSSQVTVAAPRKNNGSFDEDDSAVREVSRPIAHPKVKASPVILKQIMPVVNAPADIKLSGIAWQDERSARRAVINGFLLKEGAVVSGAKVSEILADKVRFISPAGAFDIRLDAVLPAEVKK